MYKVNVYPDGSTYVETDLEPRQWTEGREIFKDPVTDDGTKKIS